MVKEGLVAILEGPQEKKTLSVIRFLPVLVVPSGCLLFERAHMWGQEALQAKFPTFLVCERTPLVQEGAVQQHATFEGDFKDGLARLVIRDHLEINHILDNITKRCSPASLSASFVALIP
jgi:hypothetical protein